MSSIGDQTTKIVNKASTRNFDGITKFRKVKNRWWEVIGRLCGLITDCEHIIPFRNEFSLRCWWTDEPNSSTPTEVPANQRLFYYAADPFSPLLNVQPPNSVLQPSWRGSSSSGRERMLPNILNEELDIESKLVPDKCSHCNLSFLCWGVSTLSLIWQKTVGSLSMKIEI